MVQRKVDDGQVHYVADGELDGVFETDADGDGDADGVFDTDAEGDGEADGEPEAEAEGDPEGDPDGEDDAITVPRFPSSASQRNEPAEIVTEMSERKSLASANTA